MRITTWQFFWMIATVEISMTIWLTISPTIAAVKQDAWISIFCAGIIGISVTFVASKVSLLHPEMSLIQFSETILGKWPGKLVSLCYLLGWYSVTPVILRLMAEFIQLVLFFQTPLYIISVIMILLMVYITYFVGISAIGRFSEIAGPIMFIVIIVTILLNLPNISINHLFPIYVDSGMFKIVKGSVVHGSFLSESIMIMMLVPFMIKPTQTKKAAVLAVGFPSFFVLLTTMMVLATFGPFFSAKFLYPYFNMVRFISTLDFLQNMDVWVIFVWLFCVFIKLSLYLFITSYGTAQLLHIKNWKNVIWFLACLYLIVSLLPSDNVIVIKDYQDKIWIPFIFTINMVVLPLLMLGMGKLKQKSVRD